jgi:serine/threonine-protein kinase
MELSPGTLVTRNVRLVRPLGKGGMGSVWVGEHCTLETEVAVKFISPEHAQKARFVARFRREASSAAKIKSPHVVQVFDHGLTDAEVPYIVMELLKGESLSQRLKRERQLTARETGLLVAQVAKVLTIAHGLGIVHRDLKPDNLFLVESGYELFVKVLDFGIAKVLDPELNEITDTGAMVGTPYYMSPEMLLSPKDADHRADLWALAVVAYHALTGKLPFRGETLAGLSVAINDGTFAPPSAIVPELGAEIDVWFKLALCRNVELRHASATELAQSFRQALMLSADQSGDRRAVSFDAELLPATEKPSTPGRPRGGDVEAATAAASQRLSVDEAPTAASAASATGTVEPTMTSDQLERVRESGPIQIASGDDDAAPNAATLVAPAHTTLEGTSASSPRRRGLRWPWLALPAALGLAAVGLGLSRGEPTAPALTTTTASALAQPAPAEPSRTQPPAPSEAAPAPSPDTVPSAPASASARAKRAPPPPPLRTGTVPAPVPSTGRPAYCANTPFIIDAEGIEVPRPECFR